MNLDKPSQSFMVLPGMRSLPTDPNYPGERRMRGFGWLPNRVRSLFIALISEFVGTFLFLVFAFAGTQIANATPSTAGDAPNPSVLLYISLSFGFSLLVNAWIFFRISGGLFNPAVTLGLCLIGAVTWAKGIVALVSQITGAIVAAGVVSALFPGPLAVQTTLSAGTSVTRGLFIEMFLTAELVFTILMLAAEKHKATFLAPVGIGIALFVAELAGVYFTGGSLNPVRSFGPDVILAQFNGYHWIYWVGPFLGAIIAVIFYRLVQVLEYETANPGQDFNEQEAAVFDPDEELAAAEDVRRPNPNQSNQSNQGYSESHSESKNGQPKKNESSGRKPRRKDSQRTSPNSQNSETSQNHIQGRDFGSYTGNQGWRTDETYDAGRRSTNRNTQSIRISKPEMAAYPRNSHSQSRSATRSTDDRAADAYANAARAVYPPIGGGDANYSERDYGRHRQSGSHSRNYSYSRGPDAESGSAGYSDDTTAS